VVAIFLLYKCYKNRKLKKQQEAEEQLTSVEEEDGVLAAEKQE